MDFNAEKLLCYSLLPVDISTNSTQTIFTPSYHLFHLFSLIEPHEETLSPLCPLIVIKTSRLNDLWERPSFPLHYFVMYKQLCCLSWTQRNRPFNVYATYLSCTISLYVLMLFLLWEVQISPDINCSIIFRSSSFLIRSWEILLLRFFHRARSWHTNRSEVFQFQVKQGKRAQQRPEALLWT